MTRPLALLAVTLVLVGCGGTRPGVTFAAGGASAVAQPAQFCVDNDLNRCTGYPDAPVALPVPPGTPVQITVPPEVADTPWQVVFSYRDPNGTAVDERSAVFPPRQRSLYMLELPDPADRLLQVQVQQYGPPPQTDPATGEVQFPTGASWVLTVST